MGLNCVKLPATVIFPEPAHDDAIREYVPPLIDGRTFRLKEENCALPDSSFVPKTKLDSPTDNK